MLVSAWISRVFRGCIWRQSLFTPTFGNNVVVTSTQQRGVIMTTESRRDSFRRFPRRRFATSLSIDTPESSRTKPLPLRRSNQIYTCTSRSLRRESGSVFLIAFFHLRCTSTTLRRALRLFCSYCCCFLLLLFVAFSIRLRVFSCVCLRAPRVSFWATRWTRSQLSRLRAVADRVFRWSANGFGVSVA